MLTALRYQLDLAYATTQFSNGIMNADVKKGAKIVPGLFPLAAV
jgi:hypothetical protein